MSDRERSAYVTAPTGWPHDLVLEYVEHVLRDRGEVPEGSGVAARLTDSAANADHSTTWRVRYTVASGGAFRPVFRPLSLS
ncbi:hypothetical protein [Tsukamurella pseudospumae]|uniref:Uncharacterized protein n=1 Tax=Tsukamurella pseudospumae TaxID=239498 RepID=A0A138ABN4_9ACTN|nr:hypothetical protein [Tsukamurella pseudospumae]KXP01046.1 hypothetical protein AXK61_13755 [Tsukamurella pseudospumae]KXP07853.1 hypothetical protein AXK60_09560 [Tsukamurella pseudospumae]